MKRLNNVYPVYIFGRQVFVTFDHFTPNGQPVYNVEFLALTNNNTFMVKYSGVKAANQEIAAKIVIEYYERAE